MRKVLKYQKLAKDFRKRAADASNDKDKDALLRLAASWDMLATTRQMQIEKGLVQPIDQFAVSETDAFRLPPLRSLAPTEVDH